MDILFKHLSTNVRTAAGIDDLSGRFLKDGSPVLSKPVSELGNLSVKLGSFPDSFKIGKLKPLIKKCPQQTFQIPGQYCSYLWSPKSTKNLSMNKQVVFYQTMKFYTTINQDFGKTARQTHASRFSMIKFWGVSIRAWWLAWYWLNYKRCLTQLAIIYYWKNWVLYGFSKHTIGWFKSYLSNRLFRVNSKNCILQILYAGVYSETFTVSHIREWHAPSC